MLKPALAVSMVEKSALILVSPDDRLKNLRNITLSRERGHGIFHEYYLFVLAKYQLV